MTQYSVRNIGIQGKVKIKKEGERNTLAGRV